MTGKEHMRAILILGLPLIGSHLAQFAIHLVDTLMLGRYDLTALAASGLAGAFFFVIFIFGSGFAFAVMPMVAQASERGDVARLRRVTRMGLWLSTLYATLAMPAMIWSSDILQAMGQSAELSSLAESYLRIAGWGLFPALLVMVMKSYLAAMERTQVVLWITLIAVGVNAGLNWLLIFGNWGFPELGLRGAAWASLITQVASFGALAVYPAFVEGLRNHALFQRIWRPDLGAFGEVFRLGAPIGLTGLAETGMFSASAMIIGLIGKMPLAAHTISLQIVSAAFMIHMGLSQAVTVRAGRAIGRDDWAGLRHGAFIGTAMSLAVVAITMVVFLSVPGFLIGLFISPGDPQAGDILAIGASLLAVAAVFQLVDAGQVMALGVLRGMQDTSVPMILAAISYWVLGIPASYLLGVTFEFGAAGVWWGLVIGLLCACVLLWWRFAGQFQVLSGRGPLSDRQTAR